MREPLTPESYHSSRARQEQVAAINARSAAAAASHDRLAALHVARTCFLMGDAGAARRNADRTAW